MKSENPLKNQKKGVMSCRAEEPSAAKVRLTAGALQWRPVKASSFSGVDSGGGMMMLEELDDVGVEYEEDLAGRKVVHFVAGASKGKGKEKVAVPSHEETDGATAHGETEAHEGMDEPEGSDHGEGLPSFAEMAAEDLNEADDEPSVEHELPFDDRLLPDWKSIPLHSSLKRALLALGFVTPTGIQHRSLPVALTGRDVVGVAETGSGKTLAYSLPILSHLLRSPTPSRSARRPLSALVLCPTRELALQVVDHLGRVLKHALATSSDDDDDEDGHKGEPQRPVGPPRISLGSVIGGLSAQKQKRIVERGCDILVATPGRLWDLIRTDEELAAGVRGLKFLVIDEADRMIENGHFAELENIVRLTQRDVGQAKGPDDDDPVFTSAANVLAENTSREDMQTFVFSATLSKDLQRNLKKRHQAGSKKRNGKKASALEDLVDRLDFRDENPEVIDLSPEGGVVAQLKESMVECIVTDKASPTVTHGSGPRAYEHQDLYLYYFLLRYPGRTLVFVGSIDGIRRLVPLFELLQLPVYPLHSQLQQKQRLKNLDRFKSSKSGVLIATDVAARGLDIPQVDHVVHFNLPRTADAYIHRSGRTARAQNPGFALQLCAPEEKGMQRALMKSLGRSLQLPDLTIDSGFLPKLKERLTLAREIEKAQHGVKKENHDRNWLKETAEAMDLDIDPDMLSESDEDADAPVHGGKKRKRLSLPSSTKLANLKAELKVRLNEPLVARGISARYPTGGSRVIVDDLIQSTGHQTMLGAGSNKAWDEVMNMRKRPSGNAKRTKGMGQ